MKDIIFNKELLHFAHRESGLTFTGQRDVKILLTLELPGVESFNFLAC